jgi:hypothetical protein
VLYAGTTEGLFRSIDGAQTWEQAAGVVGSANVKRLTVASYEDRVSLYLAASGIMTEESLQQAYRVASSETLVSAGVYRYTTVIPTQWIMPITFIKPGLHRFLPLSFAATFLVL